MENIFNIPIMVDLAMTANRESDVIDVSKVNGYSIYAKWTGAANGTLKIQVSNDGINFVDLDDSEVPVLNSGQFMWNVDRVFYDKVKLVYVFSSGTGVLNASINGKGDA